MSSPQSTTTMPPTACPTCGISWHDCYRQRQEFTRNCCPVCPHIPDVARIRDEMRFDQMAAQLEGRRTEKGTSLIAMFSLALSLDYTIEQALAFKLGDLEFLGIQFDFYTDHQRQRAAALARFAELTRPYFEEMPPEATYGEVVVKMPADERDEVRQLAEIAFPGGMVPLPPG